MVWVMLALIEVDIKMKYIMTSTVFNKLITEVYSFVIITYSHWIMLFRIC